MVKKKKGVENIKPEFIISKTELDKKKSDVTTFMPFDCVEDTDEPRNKVIFKGSWGLYGSGNPGKVKSGISFVDKYKPQSLDDIIGNKNNIKQFQKWLISKFEKTKTNDYAVILGDHGSGKSEFIRECFKDLDFSLIEYDQSINKAEMEVIKESIEFTSIEILISGKKQKGVVIDNFQENLSTTQLTELLKLLKKPHCSPTIFVSSNDNKLLDSLNGNVLCIEFEPPTKREIFNLGKRICKNESINITEAALKNFVKKCGYDLRGFLSTLTIIDSKNTVTEDNLESIIKITQKDLNLSVDDTMGTFIDPKNKLFLKMDIDERSRYASMYTSGLIQENYINLLEKDTSLSDLSELSDTICNGDVLKKFMISNQNWDSSDLAGFMGTQAPASIIRKNYKPIKKYKNPNKFDTVKSEVCFSGLDIQDLCYSISNIYFVLEPNAKWIKQMKKSSALFREFMLSQYIDKDKAIKILSMSYVFRDQDKTVKKIKTKFRNEWKLLDN